MCQDQGIDFASLPGGWAPPLLRRSRVGPALPQAQGVLSSAMPSALALYDPPLCSCFVLTALPQYSHAFLACGNFLLCALGAALFLLSQHPTQPTSLAGADEEYDEFLGIGTGAAALFGTTGGVMEAALRCVRCVAGSVGGVGWVGGGPASENWAARAA